MSKNKSKVYCSLQQKTSVAKNLGVQLYLKLNPPCLHGTIITLKLDLMSLKGSLIISKP